MLFVARELLECRTEVMAYFLFDVTAETRLILPNAFDELNALFVSCLEIEHDTIQSALLFVPELLLPPDAGFEVLCVLA